MNRSWPVLIFALVPVLGACGDDDPAASDATGGAGGDGFSGEEAAAECTKRGDAAPACWSDGAQAECVACLTDCGNDCTQAPSCPASFACP